MLTRLRLTTAGESHGPKVVGILEGLPAGFPVDLVALDDLLRRRQTGFGSSARQRLEEDRAAVVGGVMGGRTTGGPVAVELQNRAGVDGAGPDGVVAPLTRPRPGHADLVGLVKHHHRDLRPSLERASARETAARVAAAGVGLLVLAELGIRVVGYVVRIGRARATGLDDVPVEEHLARHAFSRTNDLAAPHGGFERDARGYVRHHAKLGETLGGEVFVAVLGAPPGLGSFSQWDRRIDARLGAAVLSVQSVKAVEIGEARSTSEGPGTQAHDAIVLRDGWVDRATNRCGGIEAGVTTGQQIHLRATLKPLATTRAPQASIDLSTMRSAVAHHERSDVVAVPRAVPVLEAMVGLVVLDALLEKTGGDSWQEIVPRVPALRGRLRADELKLEDVGPWRPWEGK